MLPELQQTSGGSCAPGVDDLTMKRDDGKTNQLHDITLDHV